MTSIYMMSTAAVILLVTLCALPSDAGDMTFDPVTGTIIKKSDISKGPAAPAAVISTLDDVKEFNLLTQQQESNMTPGVTESLKYIYTDKSEDFGNIKRSDLCDELLAKFHELEIPIGMMEKVLKIRQYKIMSFLVDNSGSMILPSKKSGLTRWEEAEGQIMLMLDIIQYLPRPTIHIHFLNDIPTVTILPHLNPDAPEDPSAYLHRAKLQVQTAFKHPPRNATPLYRRLRQVIEGYGDKRVLHYVLCDGVPDPVQTITGDYSNGLGIVCDRDGNDVGKLDLNENNFRLQAKHGYRPEESLDGVEMIKQYVRHRKNPSSCPITFVSCTDKDKDVEWMKVVDEDSLLTAECDNFDSELMEVRKDQGPVFPYTRGVYLICLLVAAINPYDLDVLDESIPMTKFTYDALHGVARTEAEYKAYYDGVLNSENNRERPQLQSFLHSSYEIFTSEKVHADYIPSVQQFKHQRDLLKKIQRPLSYYQPISLGFLADNAVQANAHAPAGYAGPQGQTGPNSAPLSSPHAGQFAPSAPYAPSAPDLPTGSYAQQYAALGQYGQQGGGYGATQQPSYSSGTTGGYQFSMSAQPQFGYTQQPPSGYSQAPQSGYSQAPQPGYYQQQQAGYSLYGDQRPQSGYTPQNSYQQSYAPLPSTSQSSTPYNSQQPPSHR